MASKVRVANVQPKIAEMIDEGAEIDQKMKNMKSQDDAIKSALREVAEKTLEQEEKSVNLDGNKSMAMVTKKDSAFIKFDTETDKADFIHHVCKGNLSDVVKVSVVVDVNSARVSELLDLLKTNGYDSEMTYELNKKGLEGIEKSSEVGKVLDKVIGSESSYAVKYSFKE